MFQSSKFNQNIDNWTPKKSSNFKDMFYKSPLQNNPPKWFYTL